MAFTGFDLPDIGNSNLDSAAERRQILEYLFQLTKQLRYTLNNLGEENLSDELNSTIHEASRSAVSVERIIRNVEGSVSKIQQTANSIKLEVATKVGENEIISKINQTSESILIQANRLNLSGYVTIDSLKAGGTTTIDGGRITTGTVSAARIDVNNLYVKHLNGADGSFSGSLRAATGTFSGSLQAATGTFNSLSAANGDVALFPNYIQLGYIYIGHLPNIATQYSIIPRNTGGYGNVGIDNYYWDQVKADKLYYVTSCSKTSARRYKKNIKNLTDAEAGNIDDIRIVTYQLKDNKSEKRQMGVIAEEIETVCPYVVNYIDGQPEAVDYSALSILAIKEIQKLRKRIAKLEGK